MMRRHAPRFALTVLEYFLPDSAPLAGDLIEELERRRSYGWFWWQLLGAIATASFMRSAEIRPLRLVDLPPTDAIERSRRMSLRFRRVNLTASPVSGVGGLGLVVLAFLVTAVVPGAWWVLLGSTLAGVLMGIVLIAMHAKSPKAATTIQSHSLRAH